MAGLGCSSSIADRVLTRFLRVISLLDCGSSKPGESDSGIGRGQMKNQQRIRNLMVMALADSSLTEREVRYLTDRCVEMGLDASELHDAMEYALQDRAAIKLVQDKEEAELLLADLLRMMASDGKLAQDEKRLFAVCAAKVGFGGEETDALIDKLLGK